MRFIRCFRHDCVHGIVKGGLCFAAAAAASALFCVSFYMRASALAGGTPSLCMMDYVIALFGGMKEYVPSPTDPFLFPAEWMILVGFGSLITLRYPFFDMDNYGARVLLQSGKRSRWWLSKCLWLFVKTVLYYSVIYGTVLVCCLSFGGTVKGAPDGLWIEAFFVIDKEMLPVSGPPVLMMLMPVLLTLTLNYIQMVLCMIIGEVFAFCGVLVYLIASIYLSHPLLLGGSALLVRSGLLVKDGMPSVSAIGAEAVLIILAVAAGLVMFGKKDILKKED